MKKKPKKEKKNRVIEIHVYVHQQNSNGCGGQNLPFVVTVK